MPFETKKVFDTESISFIFFLVFLLFRDLSVTSRKKVFNLADCTLGHEGVCQVSKSPLESMVINRAVLTNTFTHRITRLATELVKARLKGKFSP